MRVDFVALHRTRAFLVALQPCFLGGLVFTFWASIFAATSVANDDPAKVEFFEKEIRPLLVEHCLECHDTTNEAGGLAIDSHEAWMVGGDSGPAIVVGDPNASRLIAAIRYDDQSLQMPPSGRLSDSQIAAFEKWVADGAVDPRKTPHATTTKISGMSIEDGHKFWSMQPLRKIDVPTTANVDWASNPIDAFVLSKLEAAGLSPAPKADKRTLIRRATFDLTGLPPTQEEIAQFEQDESPDAFKNLVERLLNSPHYGERWGRHWLDVARYADSNGLDENLAFGNAWRYRDYVIDSFNRDKPFDQFVVEQVAGDLLPWANQETQTATGFLALGARVLAEPDREKLNMDTIDEQIDTLGKAFIGMTFGCARCHDHKFDPVTQRDYYALAAIFKSTRSFADTNTGAIKHWFEHSFSDEEEKARLSEVDAKIAEANRVATEYRNQAMAAVRQRAVESAHLYLAAAAKFSPDATLGEVAEIAAEHDLHPRILHSCRLHLAYHEEDPLAVQWNELATHHPDHLASFFQQLFQGEPPAEATVSTTASSGAVDATAAPITEPETTLPQPDASLREMGKAALADHSGFITVPPQPEYAFDEATLNHYYELMEAARLVESVAPDASGAMGVSDATVVPAVPIHIRGSHRNLGDPVEREFPEVMRVSPTRPIFPLDQSGRLELAQWMASSQHPLTARVYVNRVWHWHFGRGLVATTENFGVLGARPSHPELLDWLARHFIETGWSTKQLHRVLMNSNTYQMASQHPNAEAATAADPDNQMLWKFRMRRLEAEEIRDSILFVSGRLELDLHGKMVPLRNRQFVFNHTSVDHTKYDSLRRAIYLPVIRNNVYTFFEQFDFPDPTTPTGSRNATVVAPQALLIMNDPLVMDSAVALAQLVMASADNDQGRVQWAYQRTLGRAAKNDELERVVAFINMPSEQTSTEGGSTDAETLSRFELFCQSLIASNEFIYLR